MRDACVEVTAGIHQLASSLLFPDQLIDPLQCLIASPDLVLGQLTCENHGKGGAERGSNGKERADKGVEIRNDEKRGLRNTSPGQVKHCGGC